MNIPNSKIRKAYISALPQYQIYDIAVPNDVQTPNLYITINNVTLNEYENYKEGHEWQSATSLNIWHVNEKGFVSSVNLEEVANDIINTPINIDGFKLQHREMFDCKQFEPIKTDSSTIERMVIIFKHWVV